MKRTEMIVIAFESDWSLRAFLLAPIRSPHHATCHGMPPRPIVTNMSLSLLTRVACMCINKSTSVQRGLLAPCHLCPVGGQLQMHSVTGPPIGTMALMLKRRILTPLAALRTGYGRLALHQRSRVG